MNLKDFKNLDKDQIFEMLGIETDRNTSGVLWTIGLVALGVVAGAAAALMLAPKTGREFRESVARGAKQTAEEIIKAARAKTGEPQPDQG